MSENKNSSKVYRIFTLDHVWFDAKVGRRLAELRDDVEDPYDEFHTVNAYFDNSVVVLKCQDSGDYLVFAEDEWRDLTAFIAREQLYVDKEKMENAKNNS